MYQIYIFLALLFLILFTGAPIGRVIWIPTRRKDFERIGVLAELRPNMTFYDLGSGSGGLLFYLSKKYGIKCVGVEVSPLLYLYSKIKSLFCKNVSIKYGNLFNHNIAEADVIYIFLLPKLYAKLKTKIVSESQKDSKIIFSCWPCDKCIPSQISEKKGEMTYYLYNKSALV